jgi:serine/threonine protein kinase
MDALQVMDFMKIDVDGREVPIFIMELAEGPNLRTKIKQGELSLREAIEIMFQLALIIDKIHEIKYYNGEQELPLIHGDIKPNNIFFINGKPVLGDFGIAALLKVDFNLHYMVGTPSYMAPELFKGDRLSICTDNYAFGVVVYEMIAQNLLYIQHMLKNQKILK